MQEHMLNASFAQGTRQTAICQSIHAHAHYAINAKKPENTKYLENKLNTLVFSTATSTLPQTEKWYFFIAKIFLLPD